MKIISGIFSILLLAFMLALPNHVHAQAFDLTQIKDIPDYAGEMKDTDFNTITDRIEERPKGDKYLAFQVRLPKKWIRVGERIDDADNNPESIEAGFKLSRRLLGKIVKYYGTTTFQSPSRFDIQAIELDHQITARNWFIGYVLANGFTLQGMKVVSENRIEGLYVVLEGDTSYVVRTVAIINGPRMVLVSYYVPEPAWKKERALQERVLTSFSFLDEEKADLEVKRTYAFFDVLRFDYPASWRLMAPNTSSIDGMDARLINSQDAKTLNGEIDLRILSTELDTSLPQEITYLKANLQTMGLEAGDLVETPTRFKYKPQVTYARIEVYSAKSKNNDVRDHEYWLAVLAENRYYYIISMITPSRSSNFYQWAQNTEAFQMVIETMRP